MEDVITDTVLDLESYYIQHLQALTGRLRKSAPKTDAFIKCDAQVRKTPSWPRSWANFSLLPLCSHRNAWANLRLLGQPNSFLAAVDHDVPGYVRLRVGGLDSLVIKK